MKTAKDLTLDETISDGLVLGVVDTFEKMFNFTPALNATIFDSKKEIRADISGIIGFRQGEVNGAIIVSFPQETICALLTAFYGKPISKIDQSIKLGVGELTNVIFGVAKLNLNKTGYSLESAVPTVITGGQHNVFCYTDDDLLEIKFSTKFGDFEVFTSISKKSAKSAA
ncbi:MAG: chemotaxis protein CheX [Bdellovibrionota bacterium]